MDLMGAHEGVKCLGHVVERRAAVPPYNRKRNALLEMQICHMKYVLYEKSVKATVTAHMVIRHCPL